MASASPPQEESLDDFVASESQHSDEVIEVEGPASFENITVVGSQVYALRDIEIRELIIKTEQTELPDEVKLKFIRERSYKHMIQMEIVYETIELAKWLRFL